MKYGEAEKKKNLIWSEINHRSRGGQIDNSQNQIWMLQPGPDGYPRVLDNSIFEFTTLPYSKNLTTRSSSRVVTICTLFAQTLENPAMTNENYQKSFTFFV